MRSKIIFFFFLFFPPFILFSQEQTPAEIKAIITEVQKKRHHDDYHEHGYNAFKEQIEKTSGVTQAIWHHNMAELLFDYYTKNRYNIIQRAVVASEESLDFKRWDSYTFLNAIKHYHSKVIEQEDLLSAISIEEYRIVFDTISDKRYRPSLYDAFVQSALFFSIYADQVTSSSFSYPIDSSYFFGNEYFLNIKLSSADSLCFQRQILELFQKLTAIHLNDTNPLVLIDITLNRLNYVKSCLTDTLSDILYENALLELEERYNAQNGYADICYQLGLLYHNKASVCELEGKHDSRWNYQTAIEWLQKSINQNEAASCNAKSLLKSIQEKSLEMSFQKSLPANQPNLIDVTYRNCDSLFIRIIPITMADYFDYYNDYYNDYWDDEFDSLLQKEYLYQWNYALINQHDYKINTGKIILPALPSGNYFLFTSSNGFKKEANEGYDISTIQISNIAYSLEEVNKTKKVLLYDRMTGEHINKAKFQVNYLNYWGDKIRYKQRKRADKNGLVSYSIPFWETFFSGEIFFEVRTATDTLINFTNPLISYYRYRPIFGYRHKIKETYIATDRAIYRPGETIFFKAIKVRKTKKHIKVLPHRNVEMVLLGNNIEIANISLKTNRFGSCSGAFDIPTEIRPGTYWIKNKKGGKYSFYHSTLNIQIEEYKKPLFEVIIHQPQKAYQLNEKVEIEGSAIAFSDYPISKAIVVYEIRRSDELVSNTISSHYLTLVDQGETATDELGNFSFVFTAKSDKSINCNTAFNFEITVKVIDITGETQQAKRVLFINSKALNIELEMPQVITKGKTENNFLLSVTNSNGKKIPSKVNYQIIKLKTPNQLLISRPTKSMTVELTDMNVLKETFPYFDFDNTIEKDKWEEESIIHSGILNTQTDSLFSIMQSTIFSEGYYKIILSTQDPFGQRIEEIHYFFLHDPETKTCAAYLPVFLYVDKTIADIGDTISVMVGSYYEDAHVYIEFYTGQNKLIRSEWITLNKEKIVYRIPITKKYRNGLIIFAQNTKYNHTDSRNIIVSVRNLRNSQLIDVRSSSFKSKVKTGEEEEWEIQLKNESGKKIVAEGLASMYDASLNQFKPSSFINNTWAWDQTAKLYAFLLETNINNYRNLHFTVFQFNPLRITLKFYPSLEWIFYNNSYRYYGGSLRFSGEEVRKMPGQPVTVRYVPPVFDSALGATSIDGILSVRGNRSDGEQIIVDGVRVRAGLAEATSSNQESEVVLHAINPEKESLNPIVIRKNFDETAFFYPHLKTDKKGNVSFTFKTTENLTRWNFQFLAHTKRGNIGFFTHEIVAQKELMIVPNIPRFFREGDTIDFAAKVVSLAEENLTGKISIEFKDAMTEKIIPIFLSDSNPSFNIKKGESVETKYKIFIPNGIEAITYTIKAMTDKFSDGEEKTIPVLSNRILVTESMPLYVNGLETNHFVLENLKNNNSATLENFLYTLEFTSNPSWFAIQSLPYLMQYPHECNEQIFSKMYANAIGLHILNLSPQLQLLFEKWEALPEEKFMSNLEKNQELKSMILEESPWLFDAQKQQLNKQRMGVLFNLKKMTRQQSNAAYKLESRQQRNGAWSWFVGGKENFFITQHIVAGFGHLKSMGIEIPVSKRTISRAIDYLDEEISKEYDVWYKHNSIYQLENTQYLPKIAFHYLYSRSYFIDEYPLAEKSAKFYQVCLQKAKENWENESIYMQAMIALVFHRNGETELATTIVKSLKEKAQYNDEMGMFWKKEGIGYYWYEAPIERQTALIEAFDIVLKDYESVEKMQRWILKQRQTQDWGSTKATSEACYALLLRGKETGFKEPEITIQIGTHQMDLSKHPDTEPGSGYCKTSWNSHEITSDMGDIIVTNNSKGTAWGGVYWQYFEESHHIKSAHTSLKIEKELYKVTLNQQGEFLTKLTDENSLQIGDKVIVKLIIKADRDMEYIHLKDMRAAAFEPMNVLSGYKYQGGLWFYESTRDAATHFFIDYLPKGNYVVEYSLIAMQTGLFNNGIATIQCMYAPEFSAHSEGLKVRVK